MYLLPRVRLCRRRQVSLVVVLCNLFSYSLRPFCPERNSKWPLGSGKRVTKPKENLAFRSLTTQYNTRTDTSGRHIADPPMKKTEGSAAELLICPPKPKPKIQTLHDGNKFELCICLWSDVIASTNVRGGKASLTIGIACYTPLHHFSWLEEEYVCNH
jgi:hypothetical protein